MSAQDDFLIPAASVRFHRTDEGRVVMTRAGQERIIGGMTGAFPLTRRHRMISLRDEEGEELGILDVVSNLDAASKRIVTEELDKAYFMPQILDILDVQEKLNILTFEARTNRGSRTFVVRGIRKNLRKLGHGRVVIRDVDGNRFEIRDWSTLPGPAQEMLENYL